MTNTTMGSLREVQILDKRIGEIKAALAVFDDRLAETEETALAFESKLSKLTGRLAQMNADARQLERSADDKRARTTKMNQRLNRVSNLREEAAVQTELGLIKRAIEGDEQEALQLIEQIYKSELASQELEASAQEARTKVVPEQEELIAQRQDFTRRMEMFQGRRTNILQYVGNAERRVYDAFHKSARGIVVAPLLEDGACGHCFGVIPLQLQNEIRRGEGLTRCENCGVMLTTEPEPVLDEEVEIPVEFPQADQGGEEATALYESPADGEEASLEVADEESTGTGKGGENSEAKQE